MNPLLNVAIYQLVWFVAVMGGESLVWLALVLILVHFVLTPLPKTDFVLVALVLIIGMLVDGTLRQTGFFIFAEDRFPIPLWLGCVWIALATLFNHSLHWLKERLVLAGLLGVFGGPIAYLAGGRLGAAEFSLSLPWSITILALVWGMLVPGLVYLSGKVVVAGDRPLRVMWR